MLDWSVTIENADEVYVKKLALNDWQWTEDAHKHQGGAYIPHEDRDSGFFPRLKLARGRGTAPILEAYFDVHWPEVDETRPARLVHYTSKGQETHLTNVPKAPFTGIAPASFLVVAKRSASRSSAPPVYEAIIVDSASDECALLIDLFELRPDFRSGRFVPRNALARHRDRTLEFIEQALAAFKAGTLGAFAEGHATMPDTAELAGLAQAEYKRRHPEVRTFDPFVLPKPGDVARELSRDIEYELFRQYQLRHRSLALVKVILGTDPKSASVEAALRNMIREFPAVDKILLSAAQQRKSRAGYSFEHHIERMLVDGKVPHEVQVVIESKRRPDFVLPTFALYKDRARPREIALVLSAKTTLRERWKQVVGEIRNCDLYLATVDDNIASNSIEDMESNGIRLVVPESLKTSKTTVYEHHANVLSFDDFFKTEIRTKRGPAWARLGIGLPTQGAQG